MSIRTFDGNWIIAGDGIATSDDCCCDSSCASNSDCPSGQSCCDGVCQEDCGAPCGECEDPCVCVVLHGYNFCDGNSYLTDDCDGVFEDCVQESWSHVPLSRSYAYARTEYGTKDENNFTPSVGYTVGLSYTTTAWSCADGEWLGIQSLSSSLREGIAETPFIKDRAWSYSPSLVAGSDGCLSAVDNGDYEDLDVAPQAQSSLEPLTPVISFEPCPPAEPLSLASGPGTELKALLATFGIKASPTCKCNKMARQMDSWGPEESLKHIEEIVDVMQETAQARKLPFLRAVGRKLVRIACGRARKKSPGTGH